MREIKLTDEIRTKRAKALVAMNLVERVESGIFNVASPTLRLRNTPNHVRRVGSKIICDCADFAKNDKNTNFRCEHISAVRHWLLK